MAYLQQTGHKFRAIHSRRTSALLSPLQADKWAYVSRVRLSIARASPSEVAHRTPHSGNHAEICAMVRLIEMRGSQLIGRNLWLPTEIGTECNSTAESKHRSRQYRVKLGRLHCVNQLTDSQITWLAHCFFALKLLVEITS